MKQRQRRVKLSAAAKAYLGSDAGALDQAFMDEAFVAHVQDGGPSAAAALVDKALGSENAVCSEPSARPTAA